jgi:hypothetical protein
LDDAGCAVPLTDLRRELTRARRVEKRTFQTMLAKTIQTMFAKTTA